VELVDPVGEGLAVVGDMPGAGMAFLDRLEGGFVNVAEASELDHGMSLEALALHAADVAGADLEDAQAAVLVGGGADDGGIGKEGRGAEDGALTQELTPGSGNGGAGGCGCFWAHAGSLRICPSPGELFGGRNCGQGRGVTMVGAGDMP